MTTLTTIALLYATVTLLAATIGLCALGRAREGHKAPQQEPHHPF